MSLRLVKREGEWAKHFGSCDIIADSLGRKRYLVHIVDDTAAGWFGEQLTIDSLVHEWAHARAWNHLHDKDWNLSYHGPEWGIAFAQCYCVAYGDQ